MNKNIIEINNLKVSFNRKNKTPIDVIRGIDLQVPEGKIIGVVGETLSGKTTLAKSLIGLNINSSIQYDRFVIDENEIPYEKKTNLKKYRGQYISYIPKNSATSMNPTRKIGKQLLDIVNKFKNENVDSQEHSTIPFVSNKSTKVQKYEYLRELLISLQIINPESIFNLFPHEVSIDVKQRIAIAISLIAGSKLIVLDEITSQLDSTTQSSILQLIKKVNVEFKVSFLLFTSNIWIVSKMCDYIYVMYAGKIVEKANRMELFSNPKHPYTWALISSVPEFGDAKLYSIPGSPPNMGEVLIGDPFASRNPYAVEIDFVQEPPLFEVTNSHYAATWTLHPSYPQIEIPKDVSAIINKFRSENLNNYVDDKIVESSYVEEMFTEEPKIKFDVDDTTTPEENILSQETEFIENNQLETQNIESGQFDTHHEIEDVNQLNEGEQPTEDDTVTILSRQAKMHTKIDEKIKKLKRTK